MVRKFVALGLIVAIGLTGCKSTQTAKPSATASAQSTATPHKKPVQNPSFVVSKVLDGDTIVLANSQHVRIIGIDTPELSHFGKPEQCGAVQAKDKTTKLVLNKKVYLTTGARTDKDKYGRLLRYVQVNGHDVGLVLLNAGLAKARYDSRDGYGHHPKEEQYIKADEAHPNITCNTPTPEPTKTEAPQPDVYYKTCADAGKVLHRGDPGYREALDKDHDGVACESYG